MRTHKILSGVLIAAIVIALVCSCYYALSGGENGLVFVMLSCMFGMICFNTIQLDELTHTGEDIIAREYQKILREDKKWQKKHPQFDDASEICGKCD